MLVEVDTFEEFAARHGGSPINFEGWLQFPDGARCDPHFQARWEPPTDPFELLKARRLWVNAQYQKAESEFNQFRNQQLDQANLSKRFSNVPGPRTDSAEVLTELAARARKYLDDLQAIDKKLADMRDGSRKNAVQEQENERVQRIADLESAIRGIEI